MTIVGMDDLAEVTLSAAATEVLTWETEADYATAVDSPGMVADDLGDHAGAAVAADGYHYGSVTRGLVAYYSLDEGSGTTAGDATELGNDGTITGATWNGSGQVGSDSLSFDGVDDVVTTTSPGVLGSRNRTISFWFRGTNTADGQVGVAYGDPNGTGSRFTGHFEPSSSQFAVRVAGGNRAFDTTGVALYDGVWHHVAYLLRGTDVSDTQAFVDTTELPIKSTSAVAIDTLDTNPVRVGASTTDTSYLDGDLDDVRLYDRALSTPERQALASRTQTSPVPVEATL